MEPHDTLRDPARLAALDDYGILDTPDEPEFDQIVQITTAICDVPVALVSLVTSDRQWFKARIGFEPCETDLSRSVCQYALVEPDLLVIPDLTRDDRTKNNPLVTGAPSIRFYAGAPLRTPDGLVVGSLCAIDTKPRPEGLTERQAITLRNLALQVMNQLNLRNSLAERDILLVERGRAEMRRMGLLTLGDQLREIETPQEMRAVASKIVGETLGVQRVGYGYLGEDDFVTVENDWSAPGVDSIAGRHRWSDFGEISEVVGRGAPVVVEDINVDPLTTPHREAYRQIGVQAMINTAVTRHGRAVAMMFVHADKPRPWAPEVLTFVRNVTDRVEVGIGKLKAEEDQRLLNLELSHRMKNSFAMVQAIAMQTLRHVTEKDAVEAFRKRLHALSTAHDTLLQQNWTQARISDVVRAVVGAIERIDRFALSGPDMAIGARAALSLSLLLHELTTNALKYGALSAEHGRVAVCWRRERLDGTGELVMTWSEQDGPPVREPDSRGFGSRLIKMGLVGAGGVDLRYEPTGFVAVFRAPLDEVQS